MGATGWTSEVGSYVKGFLEFRNRTRKRRRYKAGRLCTDCRICGKVNLGASVLRRPRRRVVAMDTESTDEELLERLTDETGAFELLYQRWGPKLGHLFLVLGIPRADVPDVLQTVFLELWQTADRFDRRRGTARSWIYRLARRRAMDHLRRLRIRPVPVADPEDRQERLDLAFEDGLAVREAVSGLEAHERALLELAYYGGFTQKEIALAWGVPLGTVKSWAHRALTKLNGYLAAREADRP